MNLDENFNKSLYRRFGSHRTGAFTGHYSYRDNIYQLRNKIRQLRNKHV